MDEMVIDPVLIEWIKQFLTGRKQWVIGRMLCSSFIIVHVLQSKYFYGINTLKHAELKSKEFPLPRPAALLSSLIPLYFLLFSDTDGLCHSKGRISIKSPFNKRQLCSSYFELCILMPLCVLDVNNIIISSTDAIQVFTTHVTRRQRNGEGNVNRLLVEHLRQGQF